MNSIFRWFFRALLVLALLEVGLRASGALHAYLARPDLSASSSEHLILAVGDSMSMGTPGLWPKILEDLLNNRSQGKKYRVSNTGVPGGNSRDIVAQLPGLLDEVQPETVIVMMGVFDYRIKGATTGEGWLGSLRVYKLARQGTAIIRDGIVALFRPSPEELAGRYENVKGRLVAGDPNAYTEIEGIVKADGHYASRFTGLANGFMNQGRYLDAERTLVKVIAAKPGFSGAYANLAMVYLFSGQIEKIGPMLGYALKQDPNNIDAYLDLGEKLYDAGMQNISRDVFRTAVSLNANLTKAWGFLGRIAEEQNHTQEAREYYLHGRLSQERRSPMTSVSWRRVHAILKERNIRLVAVQYPRLDPDYLYMIFQDEPGITIVSNRNDFEAAVAEQGYSALFKDQVGGVFGHCTDLCNRMLAENVAKSITT